ncbi:hypothetical protein NL676_028977 [Syzygium grande]|nr:hypothetical protein NL676_028977 [Syzygium grande]
MYSKFGGINVCVKAFDQLDALDLIGWTAIIMSYARCGIGEKALGLLELMKRKKTRPDPVTFVGVLSACSHSGLVEEGRLKSNMPIEPNALIWETMLAACKLHCDIELGTLAAKRIAECRFI